MTDAREKAIEAMASAISVAAGRNPDRQLFYTGKMEWTLFARHATAALDALLAALPGLGLAVVPTTATEDMISAGALKQLYAVIRKETQNCVLDVFGPSQVPSEYQVDHIASGISHVVLQHLRQRANATRLRREKNGNGCRRTATAGPGAAAMTAPTPMFGGDDPRLGNLAAYEENER